MLVFASWSAKNVIGPSRVYPEFGDNVLNWTHYESGSRSEFLEVSVCVCSVLCSGHITLIIQTK